MSYSEKIDLENKIFMRAYQVGTSVESREGGLLSPSEDGYLQTLLAVYNRAFRAANFKQYCSPQEALESYRLYQAGRAFSPGLTRVYSPKEFNFELILAGDL